MEKKQKISKKNCRGLIIRGQYNGPRWKLSGGIVQGAVVLGEGAIVLGETWSFRENIII